MLRILICVFFLSDLGASIVASQGVVDDNVPERITWQTKLRDRAKYVWSRVVEVVSSAFLVQWESRDVISALGRTLVRDRGSYFRGSSESAGLINNGDLFG